MTYAIRPATLEDCSALSVLAHELNLHHGFDIKPDPAQLRADFDKFEAFVIADSQNQLIGFLQGYTTYQLHNPRYGYHIKDLYICAPYQGQGLGRKLVAYIVELKSAQGINYFSLSALKTNPAAIAFYENLGFAMKDGAIIQIGALKTEP